MGRHMKKNIEGKSIENSSIEKLWLSNGTSNKKIKNHFSNLLVATHNKPKTINPLK
jgi:hypothetical protein